MSRRRRLGGAGGRRERAEADRLASHRVCAALWDSSVDMPRLSRIQFGKGSCSSVLTFALRSLPRLEYVDVGLNAFSAGDCRFPFCSAERRLRASDRPRRVELRVVQKAAEAAGVRRSAQSGLHFARQRSVYGDFDLHAFEFCLLLFLMPR